MNLCNLVRLQIDKSEHQSQCWMKRLNNLFQKTPLLLAIEKKVNISIVAALVEKGAKVKYGRRKLPKKRTFQVEEENTRNCLLSAADHGNRCRNCVRKNENNIKINDILFCLQCSCNGTCAK